MNADPAFARIAIIGLGVMGGSLARALKAVHAPPVVVGATLDPHDADAALEAEAVDAIAPAGEAIADATLIVYAAPIAATIDLIREHAGSFPDGAWAMDLASVKAPVMRAAEAAGLRDRFVGAHPICGSERSGFDSSRADLFAGASVWLVPGSPAAPIERAMEFWRLLGARPSSTEADSHDRIVAWSSHLPQLLSSTLAGALAGAGLTPADLGPGATDMTRIARSSASLWGEILEANAANLEAPLAAVIDLLEQARAAASAHDRRTLESVIAYGRALHAEAT
jgi:prephenate dehydrogenase